MPSSLLFLLLSAPFLLTYLSPSSFFFMLRTTLGFTKDSFT